MLNRLIAAASISLQIDPYLMGQNLVFSEPRHGLTLALLSLINDITCMGYEIQSTAEFDQWLRSLTDHRAKARIVRRIGRVQAGTFGDHKSFGAIGELRIPEGKGYRVYYTIRGQTVVILLCGGDKTNKRSQQRDFERARPLLEQLKEKPWN